MKAQIIRHGEVLLVPISEIPQEAKLVKEAKKHIVAHSETGHHHVLEAAAAFKILEFGGETYLDIPLEAKLLHEKTGKDVHKTHQVVPAKYKVVIKQSYDYFTKALTRVRD